MYLRRRSAGTACVVPSAKPGAAPGTSASRAKDRARALHSGSNGGRRQGLVEIRRDPGRGPLGAQVHRRTGRNAIHERGFMAAVAQLLARNAVLTQVSATLFYPVGTA
jgi:hypothetical protein